jgi:hypothetical protein
LKSNVVRIIEILFTSEERETVTKILSEECNGERLLSSSEDSIERIQLAVLKLSNGEMDKLLAAVELAQLDWQDALVLAGFGNDAEAHTIWAEEKLG